MTSPRQTGADDSLSRVRERAGVRVRARALRQASTGAEALLWSKLRDRRLLDVKFRRQRPIGPYFADFACLEIGLVIELDGGQHAEPSAVARDARRSGFIEEAGFRILRAWNHEVLQNTDAVLEAVRQAALARAATLTPTLSRTREREQRGLG